MRGFVKCADGLTAPRRTGPLHRRAPDEPMPSRSPRTRGADRDGAARPTRPTADAVRPHPAQNRSAG